MLYEENVYKDSFFTSWYSGKKKLDKNTILSDRKAEKLIKPMMADFISWLTTDYDEEAVYDEEIAEPEEETKDDLI